jgi:hypothetical protein
MRKTEQRNFKKTAINEKNNVEKRAQSMQIEQKQKLST